MRLSLFWVAFFLLVLASPTHGQPPAGLPIINSVEPQSGRAGDVVVARGANLGSESVAAVYLTDGTTDVKVVIDEQTTDLVKFKIPGNAKPGRLALMVLTTGKEARLIEEPVKITIEPETTS